MKECWDCYYSEADCVSDKWICKKKKRKVEGDAPACSSFVTEEAKSCLDCTYSEAVVGGLFTKAGTYYCNARKKKIHMDDLACSRFRE
jgi:hypothetical protein